MSTPTPMRNSVAVSRCALIQPRFVARRAIVLPTVLLLITLLALVMTSFVFFVDAERDGTQARLDGQQARLVAESGLDEVTLLLRFSRERIDASQWFNVEGRFRHQLVWSPDFDRQSDPVRERGNRDEVLDAVVPSRAWRYAVVAPWWGGPDEDLYRFGVTPESAKLNLNAAGVTIIGNLLRPLLADLNDDDAEIAIDSLLDWLDPDNEPRPNGAEISYYQQLDPPYVPKNGRLDTVEELLLIRGWSAALLWGEDTNRNGLLEPNEDDGEEQFPEYDNGDGILNPGVAPFLTVMSREPDAALDNTPRVNLQQQGAQVAALLAEFPEEEQLSGATVQFLQSIAGTDTVTNNPAFTHVGQLYVQGLGQGDSEDEDLTVTIPEGLASSPVTLEELPIIVDRISIRSPQVAQQPVEGLINLNAAPRRVLRAIPGMSEEAVAAIVAYRQLNPGSLRTIAWPLEAGLISPERWQTIAPYLTTNAYQFHVEIVAYADHTPLRRRFEWILEMIGPLAQIRYHRELTRLGSSWPLDRELPEVTAQ